VLVDSGWRPGDSGRAVGEAWTPRFVGENADPASPAPK
jgi:hypothetical protein